MCATGIVNACCPDVDAARVYKGCIVITSLPPPSPLLLLPSWGRKDGPKKPRFRDRRGKAQIKQKQKWLAEADRTSATTNGPGWVVRWRGVREREQNCRGSVVKDTLK
jgi:hypothetical protein